MPPTHIAAMACALVRRDCPFRHTPFQDADHGLENRLEGASYILAAARNVGRQRHHRARILDVFEVLAGEIGADDLRSNVGGGQIYFHAFPTTLPFRVGEETP